MKASSPMKRHLAHDLLKQLNGGRKYHLFCAMACQRAANGRRNDSAGFAWLQGIADFEAALMEWRLSCLQCTWAIATFRLLPFGCLHVFKSSSIQKRQWHSFAFLPGTRWPELRERHLTAMACPWHVEAIHVFPGFTNRS